MKTLRLSMRDLNQIIVAESHSGKSFDDMIAFLRQRGWPEISARHFIKNALAQHHHSTTMLAASTEEQVDESATIDSGTRKIAWIIAGLIITIMLLTLTFWLPGPK